MPVIILIPFILDYFLKASFYTDRLGNGAGNMSSSLLIFTPGIAALYTLIINRKQIKVNIFEFIKNSVSGIVPVGATIFFAYCISNLFSSTDIGANIGALFISWNPSSITIAFVVPLITAILGMVFPGSAMTKIFGTTIITVFASAGGNPLLAAIMLPAITGSMEGMTPPLAICMYTAMGIAGSKFKETTLNCLVWIGLHYAMSVVCLLGILPIIGL